MKKLFPSILLWLFAVCAQVQAQVDFKVSYKRVSPTEAEIVFRGAIAPGWHVYSTDIPDGGPTAASFNVDKARGRALIRRYYRNFRIGI